MWVGTAVYETPEGEVMRVTNKDICSALRVVRRHRVDEFHPWPNRITDKTIRHCRKYGYLDAREEFHGIQMAQCNYGETVYIDELTMKGKQRFRLCLT